MDALGLFELAVQDVGSDAAGSEAIESVSEVGPLAMQEGTPMKKMRLSALSGTAASGSAGGQSASMGASPSSGGDALARPCPGCARFRDSPCFLDATATVTWGYPDGRGQWCKDCQNVWRTHYMNMHSQTVMAGKLKAPMFLQEFRLRLIAYLSIKQEGADKVSAGEVEDRVNAFRFFARMSHLPALPSVVVPLEDWHAMPSLRGMVGGNSGPPVLTTLRAMQGDKLAVFVPSLSTDPGMAFEICGRSPALSLMPPLSVTVQADRKLAIDLFGGTSHGGALAEGGASPTANSAIVVPVGGQHLVSKLEAKFDSIRNSCFELLQGLTKDTWDVSLKESSFTAPLNKLYGCNAEAVSKGQQAIIDDVNVWTTGIQNAKDFMRAFREFSKGNCKNEKVSTLLAMKPLHKFLIDQGLQPAPTFTMLLCKAVFLTDVANTTGIRFLACHFKKVADLGLHEAFSAHVARPTVSAAKQVSPDPWLRSLLFRGIQLMLESLEQGGLAKCVEEVATDLEQLLGELSAKWPKHLAIASCVADVSHVQVIVAACCREPSVAPSQVDKAMAALGTPSMKPMQVLLSKSVVGQALLEGASAHIARSSQDKISDGRCNAAIAYIRDARMPAKCVDTDSETVTFEHMSCVLDGDFVNIMHESVAAMSEAVSGWSGTALEEASDKIREWTVEVEEKLRVADMVLTWGLCEGLAAAAASTTKSDSDEEAYSLGSYSVAATKLPGTPHAELQLLAFFTALHNFLDGLPQGIGAALVSRFERAKEALESNSRSRQLLRELFKKAVVLSTAKFVPESAASALDEVQSKANTAEGVDGSFCAKALALHRVANRLQQAKAFSFACDDFCIDCSADSGDDEDSTSITTVNWSDVSALPNTILELPMLRRAAELLSESIDVLLARFLEALCIPCFVFPGREPDADLELPAQIGGLVDVEKCKVQVAAFVAKLKDTSKTATTMASIHKRLFLDVLREFQEPGQRRSFDMSCLEVCPGGVVEGTPAEITPMVELLASLSDIAVSFGCVHTHFANSDSSASIVDQNHTLRPVLRAAIDHISSDLRGAELVLRQAAGTLARDKWPVKLEHAASWLRSATSLARNIKRSCVVGVATHISAFAQLVSQNTPGHSHIVNDDVYLKPVAKKFLLGWEGRAKHTDNAVALYKSLEHIRDLHGAFGLTDTLADIAGDQLQLGQSVLAEAKIVLSIIAGVSIVQTMSGAEQRTQAVALLAKAEKQLPGALTAALKSITDGQKASGSGARRVT